MPVETSKTSDLPRDTVPAFDLAWWCRNGHLQTVWRRIFGLRSNLPYKRERLEIPDGDFLDLDWAQPASDIQSTATIVLVLHGLEGCSLSKYVMGLLAEVTRAGCRGVAMNFRSCSGEINRLPRFYHSGETSDLGFVVSTITTRFPRAPIVIAGFSLGGNVLLKWLGENGDKVPDAVRAAAAVSVPYDLEVSASLIDRGLNRSVYAAMFIRTLKQKALQKSPRFPDLFDPSAIRKIQSFAQFDEVVTAPLHGFRDAKDYWMRSSSVGLIAEIRRPTLLLSAEDDPFLSGEYLRRKIVSDSRWLVPEFYRRGGHVGFIAGSHPLKPVYWTDTRLPQFLMEQTGQNLLAPRGSF